MPRTAPRHRPRWSTEFLLIAVVYAAYSAGRLLATVAGAAVMCAGALLTPRCVAPTARADGSPAARAPPRRYPSPPLSVADARLPRVSESLGGGPPPQAPTTALRQRLAELRGPAAQPHPLDARALAALAANPGCRRRALLDGAGVDKAALASALGAPGTFGQSQFAFMRGNAFEAKVKADGGRELLRLLGLDDPAGAQVPDLSAAGPEGRAARTALALREATAAGTWTLLDHPLLALDVAGSPAYLEPDAVVVHPDGRWTVVEIKSFPMVDASADAAKVGAAARQAAVYVLALERVAAVTDGARVAHGILLVCPKDFSNLPTASAVDVRKQLSVTRRQLARLTRVEDIAAALPEGVSFDLESRSADELTAAVESVPHAYAPECLAACELAFHCRDRARQAGAVETLGRSVRGELGGLTTIGEVLSAARGDFGDPADPAVAALRRAAALRAQALAEAGPAWRDAAAEQEAGACR